MRHFDREMREILHGLKAGGEKPGLLLHVCCAPCSSSVLERLYEAFRVTVFFDNPNMDSNDEYTRRLEETRRLVRETGWADALVHAPYEPEVYLEAIRGLESEPEGGLRCRACFALRLSRAARETKARGLDYFTTTLTLSPRKDAALLNQLGEEAGEEAGAAFLASDFKKRGGYPRSIELSRLHQLYRQDYCGCAFSKIERDRRRESSAGK
ncbi:MAG: epoxyqueuosine reductase QueH [Eubacteriales bacterium]|nr:epoxyqueuosine reductase QueH [Eubacteriales bacterium]